jgi:hypothetical protein
MRLPVSRKFSDRLRLGQDIVVAGGKCHVLARQQAEVIVDHGEKLEPLGEAGAGGVELREGAGGPGGAAFAGAEGGGRHGGRPGDEEGKHDARGRVGVDHLRADAGEGGGAGGLGLVRAVDIGFGAAAGQAQDQIADAVDPVGQPAHAFGPAVEGGKAGDLADEGGDFGIVLHGGSPGCAGKVIHFAAAG